MNRNSQRQNNITNIKNYFKIGTAIERSHLQSRATILEEFAPELSHVLIRKWWRRRSLCHIYSISIDKLCGFYHPNRWRWNEKGNNVEDDGNVKSFFKTKICSQILLKYMFMSHDVSDYYVSMSQLKNKQKYIGCIEKSIVVKLFLFFFGNMKLWTLNLFFFFLLLERCLYCEYVFFFLSMKKCILKRKKKHYWVDCEFVR